MHNKSTCNMLRYASGYNSHLSVKCTASSAWMYSTHITSAGLKTYALRQMKLYSSSRSMKDESDQNLLEYERKTPLEHILLRPGMYIGQTTLSTSECWTTTDNNVMEKRKLTFSPGLYKIFDEILVNAADNLNRVPKSSKLQMTRIDVTVDVIAPKNKRKGSPGHLKVSIKNDGRAIPINMHPKENMHVSANISYL
jgi:DNA topoisomerase-2